MQVIISLNYLNIPLYSNNSGSLAKINVPRQYLYTTSISTKSPITLSNFRVPFISSYAK